jgi:cystathionine beta-lyase
MDFPISPVIRRALMDRIDTDLGYPSWFDQTGGGPLGEAFAARMSRFGFAANPAHVRLFTDTNQAMQVVLHLGTETGDPVILHTPCCPPFLDVLTKIGRPPRTVPIRRRDGRWQVNLDQIADAVRGRDGMPPGRVMFLVNPHNPTGRVLTRDELLELGRLVVEHDMLVISDEVHADLTYPPHRHIPFASISEEIARRTVTLTSGSKAFNLAALRCAVAHIGVAAVRKALDDRQGLLFGQVNALGVDALRAAWTGADGWLDTVRALLRRNRLWLADHLPPGVAYLPPDATYLAWLDCRALRLGDDPSAFFLDKAKVLLFRGAEFGDEGRGFARLNFATSSLVLDELVRRMRTAVEREGRR